MWDNQTIPGTWAHSIAKTIHIKPNFDTGDVHPSCTFTLSLAFLPLLKHLWKSSFHVAVRPAFVSCWISWAYLESQEEEEVTWNKIRRILWLGGGSNLVLHQNLLYCKREVPMHTIFQSLPPNDTNQMLHYDLKGQICGTPYPSCWKKNQSGRPSAQILWPKNSSFQVIFWCTIWRTDISAEDHRQRPQDSFPVIILDRKSGSCIDHSTSPAVINFIWIWSSLRMGSTYFTHMCTHARTRARTHTHTHTILFQNANNQSVWDARLVFHLFNHPTHHSDIMAVWTLARFPSLLDSASLLLHSSSPSDSWHLYIDCTNCVQ